MMEPQSDLSDLISRVALRDRRAFDALYKQVSSKLYGVCLRMLRNRADADEALQEVFVRIWNRAGQYATSEAGAMPWLVTVARNHSIDRLRARKAPAADIDQAYDVADPGPDPERLAQSASEGRRIDACMEELEAERAAAVRRAYVDGDSYQDLADRYDVPLNTMRTWLRRSLLKLRECLDR